MLQYIESCMTLNPRYFCIKKNYDNSKVEILKWKEKNKLMALAESKPPIVHNVVTATITPILHLQYHRTTTPLNWHKSRNMSGHS